MAALKLRSLAPLCVYRYSVKCMIIELSSQTMLVRLQGHESSYTVRQFHRRKWVYKGSSARLLRWSNLYVHCRSISVDCDSIFVCSLSHVLPFYFEEQKLVDFQKCWVKYCNTGQPDSLKLVPSHNRIYNLDNFKIHGAVVKKGQGT